MKITKYEINTSKINSSLNIACVSDVHGRKSDAVVDALKSLAPDMILLAGDIVEVSNEFMRERNKNAMRFLEQISGIAPIYYCFGNHEIYYSHTPKEIDRVPNMEMEIETVKRIKELGINIINDSFERISYGDSNFLVGGLVCGRDMDPALNVSEPDLEFLSQFDRENEFKILLCHYPHYYKKYLEDTSFDLILSGHAHGGQWRLFGRGLYAPHQGVLPQYTTGIYDGRFIISRGAVNNSRYFPRLFNPCEIVHIHITPKK